MKSVTAIVLGAGGSRRLGRPKQLVVAGGEPLVRRAARVACASSCTRVLVVVGAHADEVRSALQGLPVETSFNPDWGEGIASSIRCGASAASLPSDGALLFLACDQPALTTVHLDRLVSAHARGASAAGSRYEGTLGIPALFAARWIPALLALRGDRGAKAVLAGCEDAVAIDWTEGALDVDTEADVRRLAALV